MGLAAPVKQTLVVLIILLATVDAFFPAPFGLETRSLSAESLLSSVPYGVALVFIILAIPLIWKRPKIGSLVGILAAILNDTGILLDQLGFVVPGQPPPLGVTTFQAIDVALSVVLIVLCYRSYTFRQVSSPSRNG
ncbi:MAG: hypothetical protein OK422_00110 [Thaumarchaeota archaeon]|nr:hypothetical protein [Nitrososphaerota archaeon]